MSENNWLADYELDTHRLIEKHLLSKDLIPSAITIHPLTEQIAWTDSTSGIVHIGANSTQLRLRTRENCLDFLGEGLVGIDQQGSLVFFDPIRQALLPLAAFIPALFATISLTPDRKAAVIIAGDRLPGRRIILLDAKEGVPQAIEGPALDSPITAACLDNTGAILLLATRGRRLSVFEVGASLPEHKLVRETSYRVAAGTPVRGIVDQCRIATHERDMYVIFATAEGELCIWDLSRDEIVKRGTIVGSGSRRRAHARSDAGWGAICRRNRSADQSADPNRRGPASTSCPPSLNALCPPTGCSSPSITPRIRDVV